MGDRFVTVESEGYLTKQSFEDWLGGEVDDTKETFSRRRFRSLYFDMLEVCRSEFGRVSNLHALAAYAVWRQTPIRLRVPASQIELAKLLGFTNDAVFRKWRERYQTLFSDDRTRDAVRRMVLDQVADVMDAALECAITGGYQGYQDRKLVLEIAGVHKNTLDTTVRGETTVNLRTAAELSDDDLANIAAGSG